MAVTPVDIGKSYTQGATINLLRDRLQARQDAREKQNRMRDLMAGGIPTGAGQRQAFVSDVAQVDPGMALDWAKHFASQDKATLDQYKVEAPLVVGALRGVQDDQSYAAARQYLAERGVDDLPEVYDPSTVNMALQGYGFLAGMTPQNVAEGTTVYNPLTGQPEFTGPRQPDVLSPEEMAQQTELRRAGRSQTNITLPGAPRFGKIPPGYMLIGEGEAARLVPIEGGPAAQEIAEAEEAREKGRQTKAVTGNIVIQDIDRVLSLMETANIPVAGVVGGAAAQVPGTAAFDAARLLDTIRSNVGFDKLQAMRDASPTGGALGQVSEMENRLLQATLGNLSQSQSPEQFRRNLERVREVFLDTVHGPGNRPGDQASSVTIGGQEYSMEDLEFTARKHNKTVDEVIEILNQRGGQ